MQGLANGIADSAGLATGAVSSVAHSIAATQMGVPSLSMNGLGSTGTTGTSGSATSPAAPSGFGQTSSTAGQQVVQVFAQTNADPYAIATEVGWALKTAAV